MPSVSSPSGSLPEARFCKFLVSLCVGSLIRLHGVGVFDEAKPPTPDTDRLYPYECPLKISVASHRDGLPPKCMNKCSLHFCNFRFAFYSLEIISLIIIFIAPHELGILVAPPRCLEASAVRNHCASLKPQPHKHLPV
jgi:hypothetical protein